MSASGRVRSLRIPCQTPCVEESRATLRATTASWPSMRIAISRTQTGLRRGDSGRYIDPADLTKLERAQLANVFDVVRMVQDAVRTEFNLPIRL